MQTRLLYYFTIPPTFPYLDGGGSHFFRLKQLIKVVEGAPHTAAIVRLLVTDLHHQPVEVVHSGLLTVSARVLPQLYTAGSSQ